jgi:hypothetical protein
MQAHLSRLTWLIMLLWAPVVIASALWLLLVPTSKAAGVAVHLAVLTLTVLSTLAAAIAMIGFMDGLPADNWLKRHEDVSSSHSKLFYGVFLLPGVAAFLHGSDLYETLLAARSPLDLVAMSRILLFAVPASLLALGTACYILRLSRGSAPTDRPPPTRR